MRFRSARSVLLALGILTLPATASAQFGFIPRAGIYIPAGEFAEIDDAIEGTFEVDKEAAFALGATFEISRLYVSVDYVTGSQLSSDGLDDGDDLGNGSLVALAGGFVFRPAIPFFQPHVRLGAGVKRQNYSFDDEGFDIDFPDNDTDFALHGAVGLSLMLGGLGLSAELADYVTADGFEPNDLILSLGLRLGF
jgi:hypothetical protein